MNNHRKLPFAARSEITQATLDVQGCGNVSEEGTHELTRNLGLYSLGTTTDYLRSKLSVMAKRKKQVIEHSGHSADHQLGVDSQC